MKKRKHTILSEYDRRITTWLYERPPQVHVLVGWFTLLGHPIVVGFVAMVFIFLGFGIGRDDIGIAFIVALVALVVGSSLKFVLKRQRPETPYVTKMPRKTFSFPSGHALGAMVVYGALAGVASSSWLVMPWGLLLVAGLIPLIFLIGMSRVYLGAHYLLDVVGGWLLGLPVVWWIITEVIDCACR